MDSKALTTAVSLQEQRLRNLKEAERLDRLDKGIGERKRLAALEERTKGRFYVSLKSVNGHGHDQEVELERGEIEKAIAFMRQLVQGRRDRRIDQAGGLDGGAS